MAVEDFTDTLKLDLDKDGVYEYDASAYLLEVPSIRRGRTSALEPMGVSEMTLLMGNRDGRWAPDKGVLTGLDEFTPVQLTRKWTTPAVTNIDDNPSAETDAVGGSALGGATVAQSTDESWAGGASYKVTVADADDSGIEKKLRSGSRFAVTASNVYINAPMVKGVSGKDMEIQIRWYNSGGSNFATNVAKFTFGSGWVRVVLMAVAPATAVTATLVVLTDGAQGVFDFYLDASMFWQAATADVLPYVDGDQPGCTWSGTAHESTSSRSLDPEEDLFTGYIVGFELSEDQLERVATLTCQDRLTLLPQREISLGNMVAISSRVLHRLLDRVEGELISNPVNARIGTLSDLTGYSPVNGATVTGKEITVTSGHSLFLEGDDVLDVVLDGAQALSGASYDCTSQLNVVDRKYRVVVYASMTGITSRDVRIRVLRDGGVVETVTVNLPPGPNWQRFELDVTFASLGTTRTIDVVSDVASTGTFRMGLHAVKAVDAIDRDFDDGTLIVPLINAFHEAAGGVIQDVLRSEPGILFAKKDGVVAFRDKDSRPASAIPKAVLGDGDGLLAFNDGLAYHLDAADRVGEVEITSRGTPKLAASSSRVGVWDLSPERNVSVGDVFLARYAQPVIRASLLESTNPVQSIEYDQVHFGIGCDVEVVNAATDYYLTLTGIPYNYPTEGSSITKKAATGLPVGNKLTVEMPLQQTSTAAMATEAQRLLDRYKNRIIQLALPLNNRSDEVTAWQMGLELNDLIIVRAENKAHSPGIDKKFWVEGIEHQIGRGGVLATLLRLEEA